MIFFFQTEYDELGASGTETNHAHSFVARFITDPTVPVIMALLDDAVETLLRDVRLRRFVPDAQLEKCKALIPTIDPEKGARAGALFRIVNHRKIPAQTKFWLHQSLLVYEARTDRMGQEPHQFLNVLLHAFHAEFLIRNRKELLPYATSAHAGYERISTEATMAADALVYYAGAAPDRALRQALFAKALRYGVHAIRTQERELRQARTPTILNVARDFKRASNELPQQRVLLEKAVHYYEHGFECAGKNGEEIFTHWYRDAGVTCGMLSECLSDPVRKSELGEKSSRYAAISRERSNTFHRVNARAPAETQRGDQGQPARVEDRFLPQTRAGDPRLYSKDK